jgi:hypothetical protein
MGRPVHYSTEVPARCQALIEMLVDKVESHSDPDGRWGGPLKTTFLLAMATPMLVLPLERVFKPVIWGKPGIADEVSLDPALDARIAEVFSPGKSFHRAPFYEPQTWTFIPEYTEFEVARDWPEDCLRQLGSPDAAAAAGRADASQILIAVRNALSHGGITYLDRDGGHTRSATNMLGFASLVRQRDPTRLRLLRATVTGFEAFLRLWAEWLSAAGVTDELDERGPGYFSYAAE